MRRFTAIALLAVAFSSSLAHAEKILRYALPASETGFDPQRAHDLYSRYVICNIFGSGLRYNWLSRGEIEPNLFVSLPETSPDFRTFTFHVKRGVYFADDAAFNGKKRELVAEDFVYALKRIYDPHEVSPFYGDFESLKIESLEALRKDASNTGKFDYDKVVPGVRTLDPYTFQVQLGSASPRFAEDNFVEGVLPVAREVVEKYGDAIGEHPVGTGPYMLAEWVRSSRIVLVRNPNFHDDFYDAHPKPGDDEGNAVAARFKGRKMPFIDRVEISIIEESQPRWLAFLNGEHDLINPIPLDMAPLAIPNNKLAPNLARQHVQYWRQPAMQVSPIIFNMENPVVGGYTPEKVALRRAIGLGYNSPRMIASIFKYQGLPAQSPFLPGQYGYDPTMRSEMGQYDPARANAILDTYGYLPRHGGKWRDLPDGTPFTIEFMTEPDQLTRSIDELLKKSMDDLGIRINFTPAKWPDQYKLAQSGNYMMWFLGQSSTSLDPSGGFLAGYGPEKGGGNLPRFEMASYDQLFRESQSLPNGPERLAKLHQMADLLIAYEPYKYTYIPIRTSLAFPWVEGWRMDPLILGWWQYVDIDEAKQKPHLR
jgi:ABC-type transport system substrate-binding protein